MIEVIRNIDQLSTEWWNLRKKRLTASHATAIGTNGKGLVTYIEGKMAEYFSVAERDNYTNADLERGKELEDEAGLLYNWETNNEIEKICFVVYNDYIGVSPDLFSGTDGLCEIKCPKDKVYFKLLLNEKIDSNYTWQCQMQMLVCEKEWCDLTFYNPNFERKLYIKRILPDKEKFEKLKIGFKSGEKMINDIIQQYKKGEQNVLRN